jgi:hypothetical protein
MALAARPGMLTSPTTGTARASIHRHRTRSCSDPPGRLVGVCVSISGPSNLYLPVWLRTLRDLETLERRLAAHTTELTITERAVSLWTLKLGGHVLDPDGRRLRSIPLVLWPDQPPARPRSGSWTACITASTRRTEHGATYQELTLATQAPGEQPPAELVMDAAE